jgi:hypothetical protein
MAGAMKGLRMVWIWIKGSDRPTTIRPNPNPTQQKLMALMGVDLEKFYQKLEIPISFSP